MTQSYLLLLLASHVLQVLQHLHLVRTHCLHLALQLGPGQGNWNQDLGKEIGIKKEGIVEDPQTSSSVLPAGMHVLARS